MPRVHRDTDDRICGAITIVVGQSTVYSNNLLWAVKDDPNSHGNGGLIPSGSTVFIENKLIIVHEPDDANPDDNCPPTIHCNPQTAEGSPDVYTY